MKTNSVKRCELKHNIMKEIILRIDYQGILEIEEFIKKIQPKLKENFSNYEVKFMNGIEVQIHNPEELSKTLSLPIKEITKQPIHVYTQNKHGNDELMLNISKYTTDLSIKCKNYKGIDEYLDLFEGLVQDLKEKNDFFTEKRFGMRKISYEIFKNQEDAFKCFQKTKIVPEIDGFEIINGNTKHRLKSKNDFTIDYKREIEDGTILEGGEKIKAYRIILDFDGFFDENKLKELNWYGSKNIKPDMLKLNEDLFELFTNSVTEDFITKCKGEN